MELYSATKNKNQAICRKMEITGDYCIQQGSRGLERQTSHAISYMRTLALVVWAYMGISLYRCLGARK